VALLLEPGAELEVVVDLAVDDRGDLAGLVEDRLMAMVEIDDGQAPVTQNTKVVCLDALVVGSAVDELREHPLNGGPAA
jgi:hypothetical protein